MKLTTKLTTSSLTSQISSSNPRPLNAPIHRLLSVCYLLFAFYPHLSFPNHQILYYLFLYIFVTSTAFDPCLTLKLLPKLLPPLFAPSLITVIPFPQSRIH